jgi:hypothetical protein
MNLKNILDTYTKKGLLDTFFDFYPEQKVKYEYYNFVLDKLKSLETEDTPFILHVDMNISDGKDVYDVYGIDDENERINLSFLPWPVWISMKIDEQILEYLDEKDLFAHVLLELSLYGKNTGDTNSLALEFAEIIENLFNIPVTCIEIKSPDSESLSKEAGEAILSMYNIEKIGTINIESDELIISDSKDYENRLLADGLKPGIWHVSIADLKYDEYTPEDIDQSKPDYVEISLQHEDIKDEDIHDFMSERYYTMGEDDLEVPSKQIIIIDNEKFNNLDICNKDIIKPKLLSNGLICPIGLSNGPFSVYFSKNENDEIIAMKISLANNEHEEY